MKTDMTRIPVNLDMVAEAARVYESHVSGISWTEETAYVLTGRELDAAMKDAIRDAVDWVRDRGGRVNNGARSKIRVAIVDFVSQVRSEAGGCCIQQGAASPEDVEQEYQAVQALVRSMVPASGGRPTPARRSGTESPAHAA